MSYSQYLIREVTEIIFSYERNGCIMITMDSILGAKFGAEAGTLEASFRKTVKTKEYETEVVEVRAKVDMEPNASGIDRMMGLALLEAQIEYSAYSNLVFKGVITEAEFAKRKEDIERSVNAVATKYVGVTGESPADKFNIKI